MHCHGSTPAWGVDKTDARSKLHITFYFLPHFA
ncbi:unnamed protein product [Protopolystoma xenopodis]|uniref:Uncharacterized protein n=1 Tax=Protopolystoma xenopodis TaxID=117903 RepID=A0A3S5BBC8_9PLAT|nr:unnamed protein product [Protopolystoma xenopodis]